MTAPNVRPWHTLTPEQQAQAWQQHHNQQLYDVQRQQLALQQQRSAKMSSAGKALLVLFVGFPIALLVLAAIFNVIGNL